MGEKKVRLDYDRNSHDRELEIKWPRPELRPYYDLERRYTHREGTIFAILISYLINLF